MTAQNDFNGVISDWLDEQAGRGAPDYLDEILLRTTRTRQRPAWSSLERWLPVQTTFPLVRVPRLAWIFVILGLLVALGAAALLMVGGPSRAPAPFGLARNGLLLYSLPDGNVYALNTSTGKSTAVLAGAEIDRGPLLSNDGSRFLFDRTVTGSRPHALMVANADGSQVQALGAPLANVDSIAWSPDGLHVSMSSDADGIAAVRIVGLDGSTALVIEQKTGTTIEAIEDVQWRPDGRELIFRGWSTSNPSYGLYAVRSDGTHLRPILPTTTDRASEFGRPALSPDGTRIAYTVFEGGAIHIVDVDTGIDRTPAFVGYTGGDLSPNWSPDGKWLVFQRTFGSNVKLMVAPATGGPVVETGPAAPVDSGGVGVTFSPDGTRLVARYAFDQSTWILDVNGGPGERQSASVTDLASWQRLAP